MIPPECGQSDMSRDDSDRVELMWDSREELLVRQWSDAAGIQGEQHEQRARVFKSRHLFFGFLSMFASILFTGLSSIDVEAVPSYAPSFGFVLTGTLSAICTFFDFATLRSKHGEYANKYREYASEIQVETCKPRRNRVACDVFLQSSQMRLNSLNRNAPDL